MSTTQARSTRRRDRAVVAAAAIVTPVVVWALITYAFGVHLTVPETFGSQTRVALEPIPVIGTVLAAVLAGWALLAVLERLAGAKALTIWTTIAVIVFLGTLPYLPGFTVTERVLLGLVHLSLALVLVLGLRRTARAGTR